MSNLKKIFSAIFLITVLSVQSQSTVKLCSWNIQFLGHYTKKDNTSIASYLRNYDIVVIQELVATPFDLSCRNGTLLKKDQQASEFFETMKREGFNYFLSYEDTGSPSSGSRNSNTTSTEFFVVFYKDSLVSLDTSLANYYLDENLFQNKTYTRVPHAFSFKTLAGNDFTLISVHLEAGDSNYEIRQKELEGIYKWISANDSIEKDFIILGDFNLKDKSEHDSVLCDSCASLNENCQPTSLGAKPYDHVFYNPNYSFEVMPQSFSIINIKEVFKKRWRFETTYPEYDDNIFKQYYSDHLPVSFEIMIIGDDD